MAHKDGRECPVGTKNHEQVPRDHLGPKEWVKSEPECHKCAVKWQYFLQIQSNFWPFLPIIMATKQPRRYSGWLEASHIVPKNHENQLSVQSKSKY